MKERKAVHFYEKPCTLTNVKKFLQQLSKPDAGWKKLNPAVLTMSGLIVHALCNFVQQSATFGLISAFLATTRWEKTGLCLSIDNWPRFSSRNPHDMPNISASYLEKVWNLNISMFKNSLLNLQKSSPTTEIMLNLTVMHKKPTDLTQFSFNSEKVQFFGPLTT